MENRLKKKFIQTIKELNTKGATLCAIVTHLISHNSFSKCKSSTLFAAFGQSGLISISFLEYFRKKKKKRYHGAHSSGLEKNLLFLFLLFAFFAEENFKIDSSSNAL